jgi:dipeptidyl aminopeptidase/acylaminoacyl peptidase
MILLAAFLLYAVSFAAPKRAITFEDFFSMKRLGVPAVSPDGGKIAFAVKIPDISENKIKTDIWLMDSKTGAARPFTNADASSNNPAWSPDGKFLYFDRSDQIWKQAVDGGEALQVTSFAAGASGAVISPDGKQMLFTAEIYPGCLTEDCNRERLAEAERSLVKARVIDKLFYRHWNAWREGKRSHVFLCDADGKNTIDKTPGDYDSPPVALGGDRDYAFSPDGREICFVRNMDEMTAISTNNDLYIVSAAEGNISKISLSNGNDNSPAYSPDGRYIAYLSMEHAGFEADRQRIMLYNRKENATRELSAGFNLSAASLVWHPSGDDIYFLTDERGNFSLYKVNVKTAKIKAVLKDHFINSYCFMNDKEIILSKQTAAQPSEIYKYNLKSGQLTQLSQLNTALLAELELPQYESFWFTGAKGDSVQGFLLKPPFFDAAKKYPAIELIHGGPQGSWGDDFHYRWNYQMFASDGYVVFMINFHGSTGYGQKFTDSISKDWGGAPYKDVILGTEYVINKYPFIDRDRIGAAGASYGGFMINWIAGEKKQPFKCMVSHDGVFDQPSMYGATEELWFPEWEYNGAPWDAASLYNTFNPADPQRIANFTTPILVVHGERDFRVPYNQGLHLFTVLQRKGIKSRLLFFPDEDHFVQKPQNARLWWKTVHEWFADFLKIE